MLLFKTFKNIRNINYFYLEPKKIEKKFIKKLNQLEALLDFLLKRQLIYKMMKKYQKSTLIRTNNSDIINLQKIILKFKSFYIQFK